MKNAAGYAAVLRKVAAWLDAIQKLNEDEEGQEEAGPVASHPVKRKYRRRAISTGPVFVERRPARTGKRPGGTRADPKLEAIRRRKIGESIRAKWASMTPTERAAKVAKMQRVRAANRKAAA